MSSAKQVVSNGFESSASERLARFIAGQGIAGLEIAPLTPDASTRKYFRIPWKKGRAVAAVYPEPFDPELLGRERTLLRLRQAVERARTAA